ncbi:hypothetical protein Tco_1418988 [Tanacetum coccineum]
MPRECLKIIESKSKVRQPRNKAVVAKMSYKLLPPRQVSLSSELKDKLIKGPAPQTHGVSKTDFEDYVTSQRCSDEKLQNQGQNLQSQMGQFTDMLSKFVTVLIQLLLPSGTLLVTLLQPKEELKGEITLRVGKEAITFNLDQTSKYTADYDHITANKIDVIDLACDEYSQDVLGFSNMIASGNPTPYFEPIVSTTAPNLTPFGDSDFLLMEEADSFLALEEMIPTSSEVEPPPPLPNQEQYLPEVRKELKLCEAKTVEPSVDEPPEVELKELPPHLEYAFLEEVKGSTLKQSTAEPTNIPKGYTQAASSKVPTAPNYASHSDEIICSFFSQQASMPTTHDDEDLLQIDEDA